MKQPARSSIWLGLALGGLIAMRLAHAAEIPVPERNPLRELKPGLAGVVTSGHALPLPERRPKGLTGSAKSKDAKAEAKAQKKPEPLPSWTATEIAAAKAECAKLTKGLSIDFRYAEPIRQGQCGTAQPIEVKSLGSGQKVTLSPPAVMNCRMAAMLTRWIDTTVQPKAKDFIGKPIARLTNASSYVCRNRYGAKDQKLSEHARANAFDVSAFVTTDGRSITVADHWGPTMAAIEAKQADETARLAKAAEDVRKAEATKVASTSGAVPQSEASAWAASEDETATIAPPPEAKLDTRKKKKGKSAVQPVVLGDLVKGEPLIAAGSQKDRKRKRGVLVARPAELQPKSPEGKFLHAIHAGACEIFGTVLGPEANAAHHDHLHVDLQARRKTNFCQ